MKVFFLTSSETASGGSRQALYVARGLMDRGHEVMLLAPKGSPLPQMDPAVPSATLPGKRRAWRNNFV